MCDIYQKFDKYHKWLWYVTKTFVVFRIISRKNKIYGFIRASEWFNKIKQEKKINRKKKKQMRKALEERVNLRFNKVA